MTIDHQPPQQQPRGGSAGVQAVTAAVLHRNGRVLIARRPATDNLARKWEFPGGKIEEGETPEACLARELREELGIDGRIGAFLGESVHHYRHGTVRLLAYLACWEKGDLEPRAHDEIAWVTVSELDQYDFAPADVPFVERLMSGQWIVSDAQGAGMPRADQEVILEEPALLRRA